MKNVKEVTIVAKDGKGKELTFNLGFHGRWNSLTNKQGIKAYREYGVIYITCDKEFYDKLIKAIKEKYMGLIDCPSWLDKDFEANAKQTFADYEDAYSYIGYDMRYGVPIKWD